MPATFGEIIDRVREVLTDVVMWPDATLLIWINQGIRDYSHYLPYATSGVIDCTLGTKEYVLGESDGDTPGLVHVIKVEYPDGQTPKRFLTRLNEDSTYFNNGQYYDLRGDPSNYLVIGESPVATDDICVQYTGLHTTFEDVDERGTETTVPSQHLEALSLFCIWKAAEEVFMTEEIDPDTKEFLISQMGLNAMRYERVYRNKIAEYQSSNQSLRAGPWAMDEHDRIY